jgi:membrane protein YdbS with pleckstrin-like domain
LLLHIGWMLLSILKHTNIKLSCPVSGICKFSLVLIPTLLFLCLSYMWSMDLPIILHALLVCVIIWYFLRQFLLHLQVNYGNFMHGLLKENIQLNRKVLSEISMHEPYSFKSLVDVSRNAFPGNKNVVVPPRKVTF